MTSVQKNDRNGQIYAPYIKDVISKRLQKYLEKILIGDFDSKLSHYLMALALALLIDWRNILSVPLLELSDRGIYNSKKNAVHLRTHNLIQSVQ